jgi:hypothetical protein
MVLTIDVGHPPRKPEKVEREIYNAIEEVRKSSKLRIIKVVHGNGSATRTTVRNWAYRNGRLLRAAIPGENYDLFDASTQELRSECGQYSDPDIGRDNKGITILWVK